MRDAVIFNGPNALDFFDVRSNIIRIPEVVHRIRQAQEVWDEADFPEFDFTNFISSDNNTFLSNLRSKSLAAAIVQVGLYDRYVKHFKAPQYLVGNLNGDSAMQVASGELNFEDMILNSSATRLNRAGMTLHLTDAPLLAGVSLTEYGTIKLGNGSPSEKVDRLCRMDIEKIVEKLIEDEAVQKFVNIGPGNTLLQNSEFSMRDVQILESVDLDPLLSWFWTSLKENQLVG